MKDLVKKKRLIEKIKRTLWFERHSDMEFYLRNYSLIGLESCLGYALKYDKWVANSEAKKKMM